MEYWLYNKRIYKTKDKTLYRYRKGKWHREITYSDPEQGDVPLTLAYIKVRKYGKKLTADEAFVYMI